MQHRVSIDYTTTLKGFKTKINDLLFCSNHSYKTHLFELRQRTERRTISSFYLFYFKLSVHKNIV